MLVFFLLLHFAKAQTYTADLVQWHFDKPVTIKTELPLLENPSLKNDYLEIEGVPATLKPDLNNHFSIDPKEESFAYLHTYYHATQQLISLNKILGELKLPLVKGLKISLNRKREIMPHAGAMGGKILMEYANPFYDPSILAHEIGHEVHSTLVGRDLFLKQISESYKNKDWKIAMTQLGVMEGTANFLGSLRIGIPTIGKIDYFEAAVPLDNFIRFPDLVPTVEETFRRYATAKKFTEAYPKSKDLALKELQNSTTPEIMKLPDPYFASAVINQPLWQAANEFGKEKVLKVYLLALSDLKEWKGYSDLAKSLLKVSLAQHKPLYDFLIREFKVRGLEVAQSR